MESPDQQAQLAVASKDHTMPRPQLKWYACRGDGSLVPLIPADELPAGLELEGVPRVLAVKEATQLLGVGFLPDPPRMFKLKETRIISAPPRTNGREAKNGTGNGFLAKGMAKAHAKQPVRAIGAPAQSTSAGPSKLTSSAATRSIATSGQLPLPSGIEPDLRKKEYCTYFLRHQACDYMQQGCAYKHEIPDDETLRAIGLADVVRDREQRRLPFEFRHPRTSRRQGRFNRRKMNDALGLRQDLLPSGSGNMQAGSSSKRQFISQHNGGKSQAVAHGIAAGTVAIEPSSQKTSQKQKARAAQPPPTPLLIDLGEPEPASQSLRASKHAIPSSQGSSGLGTFSTAVLHPRRFVKANAVACPVAESAVVQRHESSPARVAHVSLPPAVAEPLSELPALEPVVRDEESHQLHNLEELGKMSLSSHNDKVKQQKEIMIESSGSPSAEAATDHAVAASNPAEALTRQSV